MLEYEEASKITGREGDRQWKVGCSFWAEWARLDVGRRGHHLVGGIVSDFFSFFGISYYKNVLILFPFL